MFGCLFLKIQNNGTLHCNAWCELTGLLHSRSLTIVQGSLRLMHSWPSHLFVQRNPQLAAAGSLRKGWFTSESRVHIQPALCQHNLGRPDAATGASRHVQRDTSNTLGKPTERIVHTQQSPVK